MITPSVERLMAVWNRQSLSKAKLKAMSLEEILLWCSIQSVLNSKLIRNGEGGNENLDEIRKRISKLPKGALLDLAATAIKLQEEARSVLYGLMKFAQPNVAGLSANDKHQRKIIKQVDDERGRYQSLISTRKAADKTKASVAGTASGKNRRKAAEEAWQAICVRRAKEMVKAGIPRRELAGRLASRFHRTPRTIRDLLKKAEVY